MKKTKLNRYKIVYDTTGGGHHPLSIELEASGVREHGEYITLFDEHGEDECKFYKEDIVQYYKIIEKPTWPSDPEFIEESEVNWVGPKPNDGIPKIKFITLLGILGFIAYSILLLYIGGRLS